MVTLQPLLPSCCACWTFYKQEAEFTHARTWQTAQLNCSWLHAEAVFVPVLFTAHCLGIAFFTSCWWYSKISLIRTPRGFEMCSNETEFKLTLAPLSIVPGQLCDTARKAKSITGLALKVWKSYLSSISEWHHVPEETWVPYKVRMLWVRGKMC